MEISMGKPQTKTTLAYTYFVKLIRDEHKRKHPGEDFDFNEFAVKCSERWQKLKPEEKKCFEDAALKEVNKTTRKRLCKQPKKDPFKPKRAWSSFFFFCDEQRPKVRKEHQGWRVSDIARELGKLWEACIDRDRYEKLASLDKGRYDKEMEQYRAGVYVVAPPKRPRLDENGEVAYQEVTEEVDVGDMDCEGDDLDSVGKSLDMFGEGNSKDREEAKDCEINAGVDEVEIGVQGNDDKKESCSQGNDDKEEICAQGNGEKEEVCVQGNSDKEELCAKNNSNTEEVDRTNKITDESVTVSDRIEGEDVEPIKVVERDEDISDITKAVE